MKSTKLCPIFETAASFLLSIKHTFELQGLRCDTCALQLRLGLMRVTIVMKQSLCPELDNKASWKYINLTKIS